MSVKHALDRQKRAIAAAVAKAAQRDTPIPSKEDRADFVNRTALKNSQASKMGRKAELRLGPDLSSVLKRPAGAPTTHPQPLNLHKVDDAFTMREQRDLTRNTPQPEPAAPTASFNAMREFMAPPDPLTEPPAYSMIDPVAEPEPAELNSPAPAPDPEGQNLADPGPDLDNVAVDEMPMIDMDFDFAVSRPDEPSAPGGFDFSDLGVEVEDMGEVVEAEAEAPSWQAAASDLSILFDEEDVAPESEESGESGFPDMGSLSLMQDLGSQGEGEG